MRCYRGCCATQKEHYQSLSVASAQRGDLTKSTVDDHDTHTATVTEHWHDQQDVTIRPKTLQVKVGLKQGEE